jgi:hypothetical protein
MDHAIEIAPRSLSHGADPRIMYTSGKTPMDYAKNSEMKDAFSKHGAT